jgi:dihydroxyacid dehydratase/phosphogluconate dehydratase
VTLLVNLQPAGEYLGEDFYRAGGVPAVVAQLLKHGLIFGAAPTANGRTLGANCAAGGYVYPESQTPWQEMQRATIGQMVTAAVLEPAIKYQRIARKKGIPRRSH